MSWGELVLTNVVDLPDNLHQSPLHSDVTKSMEMVAVPFNPKLYLVSKEGNENYLKGFLKLMPLTRGSLNEDDVFVLDSGRRLYIWSGEHAAPCEKLNAKLYADHEETKRGSDPAILTHDTDNMFWDLLDGKMLLHDSYSDSNLTSDLATAPTLKVKSESIEIVDTAPRSVVAHHFPTREMAQDAAARHIQLKLKDQQGIEVQFKIKKSIPLRNHMDAYCSRLGLQASQVRFMFDGKCIAPDDTAEKLGLEDEDRINVAVEQTGCF